MGKWGRNEENMERTNTGWQMVMMVLTLALRLGPLSSSCHQTTSSRNPRRRTYQSAAARAWTFQTRSEFS
eukprot:6274033-Amphidinium_carterae.1